MVVMLSLLQSPLVFFSSSFLATLLSTLLVILLALLLPILLLLFFGFSDFGTVTRSTLTTWRIVPSMRVAHEHMLILHASRSAGFLAGKAVVELRCAL